MVIMGGFEILMHKDGVEVVVRQGQCVDIIGAAISTWRPPPHRHRERHQTAEDTGARAGVGAERVHNVDVAVTCCSLIVGHHKGTAVVVLAVLKIICGGDWRGGGAVGDDVEAAVAGTT